MGVIQWALKKALTNKKKQHETDNKNWRDDTFGEPGRGYDPDSTDDRTRYLEKNFHR